ncbi:hypothetical protein [Methanosarcina sp. UBA5]|uniref:hypothetical protein n=1 Tax=Methanosarcina sp. UBA5 TaxID=1915593 RepID=UPI0025E107F8|nr:hypothetical protein [Methanosarcina sp. UBA5]
MVRAIKGGKMHTSLIILQYKDLNTILPYIDYFAKKYSLSRADVIRSVLYQYFEYQTPERSSKQKEQERKREISLQLTFQDKYIPIFFDIDFQDKYLGTNSFTSMLIIVNILNKFFNFRVPLKILTKKQLKHTFNPQAISNFDELLTEIFHQPRNSVYKYDLKLLYNLDFFKKLVRENGTMTRRNLITEIRRENYKYWIKTWAEYRSAVNG